MFHPSRGGVRGGQDQFSWDNVKEDKYRENYLGHSLKAPVGRWQKGKDLTWYAKDDKSKEEAREKEIQAIKDAEEEAMLEALGYPVKKKRAADTQIDAKELQNILQKGNRESEEGSGQATYDIKGLGFKDSHSKSLTGKLESTKFTSSITNHTQQTMSTNVSSLQHEEEEETNETSVKASHSKHKSKKKEKKSKSKHKHKEKKHKYHSDAESSDERHGRLRHAPSSRQTQRDHYTTRERNSRSPTRLNYRRDEDSKETRDVNRESSYRRENSPVTRSRYPQRERARRYLRSRSPDRYSRDRRDRR